MKRKRARAKEIKLMKTAARGKGMAAARLMMEEDDDPQTTKKAMAIAQAAGRDAVATR